jgi:hypothetical protein
MKGGEKSEMERERERVVWKKITVSLFLEGVLR